MGEESADCGAGKELNSVTTVKSPQALGIEIWS